MNLCLQRPLQHLHAALLPSSCAEGQGVVQHFFFFLHRGRARFQCIFTMSCMSKGPTPWQLIHCPDGHPLRVWQRQGFCALGKTIRLSGKNKELLPCAHRDDGPHQCTVICNMHGVLWYVRQVIFSSGSTASGHCESNYQTLLATHMRIDAPIHIMSPNLS
jgi:hypothetical protein